MKPEEKNSQQDLNGAPSANLTTLSVAPKIMGLHPKVADALAATITECKARRLNVGMHMGLRTAEQQNALYALGRTAPGSIVTNAQAWMSWHCYGLAVDVVFKDSNGNWTWDSNCDWDGLGKVGKIFGFMWGGDWTKFPDMPHFQMIGRLTGVKEAKRITFSEGIDSLWNLI